MSKATSVPRSARPGSGAVTPSRPAPRPAARFAGQLLVYADGTFTPAQVAAVGRATGTTVAAVYLHEEDVASDNPAYPDVPVLAMVADPASYAAAAGDRGLVGALAGGAVLASSEAALRHVRRGGTLRFADGRRVRVAAVVDDHVLGGNEIWLPAASSTRHGDGADYLLVGDRGAPDATAEAVRRALPHTAVAVEAGTANGYLGPADRVLTQLQVKQRFGEFAIRRTGPTTFDQDPGWRARYLLTTHVSQLGTVTCNRLVMPALTAAMDEITRRGLGSTVHTADFQYEGGCWNPNVIPGEDATISRHSWGLAADINVDTNPFGYPPRQDPRLLSVMDAHGFTWGGRWLTPDGMHFEFVGISGRAPWP